MPELPADFRRIIHRGGDLSTDKLAETGAQAMDRHFHGGLGYAERAGGIRLGYF